MREHEIFDAQLMLRALIPAFAVAVDGDPEAFLPQLPEIRGMQSTMQFRVSSGRSPDRPDEGPLGVGDLVLEILAHDPRDDESVFVVLDSDRWLNTDAGARAIKFFLAETSGRDREIRTLLFVCSKEQRIHPSLYWKVPRVSDEPCAWMVPQEPAPELWPDEDENAAAVMDAAHRWVCGAQNILGERTPSRKLAHDMLTEFVGLGSLTLVRTMLPLCLRLHREDWSQRLRSRELRNDLRQILDTLRDKHGWPYPWEGS